MELPLLLAGPILRRVERKRFVAWLATSQRCDLKLTLSPSQAPEQSYHLRAGEAGLNAIQAGKHLHFLLLDVPLDEELPSDTWVAYQLALGTGGEGAAHWRDLGELAPDLCYDGHSLPGFRLSGRVHSVLHGSCRKPHHGAGDGLVRADQLLAQWLADSDAGSDANSKDSTHSDWPAALMLSGDQIYADDVAGPLLRRIHHLIPLLGLPDEPLAGAGDEVKAGSAEALYQHPDCYYRRDRLLPQTRRNRGLAQVLFRGAEKPVFTTANARNHLITLAEMLVMYLLVWSPTLWRCGTCGMPKGLDQEEQDLYRKQDDAVEGFAEGLAAVQRLFAHIPVAMIFDDHDVTDDWNLTRGWEESAYGHPFSSRVIGNALLAYLLCQGWGNSPDAFPAELMQRVANTLKLPGGEEHDNLLVDLLRFDHWHYVWNLNPPLVVADCRTHRWRSESSADKPSGLMDWEALTDLQHDLKGLPAVLLVSSAPIFGVKLIEVIQRVFTYVGLPLMVDAENWMSHRGAASAILNIFRHSRTPGHFVILSGDVHYSFVYDVELRGRLRGPDIYQICSSGLANSFPERLLATLDHLNRWLYSPRSPLNWLTRRRSMRVIPRKPEGTPHGRRLLNGAGIGLVELDDEGVPTRICQYLADGGVVEFTRREHESRWR
ncbi:alkaline phosphatase family protein [Parahaliea aestuarii]|uniref:Alkaline phosphatase family protein n=1 Tax=Parahaliea aestuarii TaxID=1852021 RepID=A0A5C8ZYM1_9GAMM|nr:alkaline phosphatase family protein [Parahaliea aestuarii]TXS92351.1 alkaline phosphatase family protein [Parahaliea aestuarii]